MALAQPTDRLRAKAVRESHSKPAHNEQLISGVSRSDFEAEHPGKTFRVVRCDRGRHAAGSNSAALGNAASLGVDTDFLQQVGARLLAGRYFNNQSSYDRQLIDRSSPNTPSSSALAPAAARPAPAPAIRRVPVIATMAILPLIGADSPAQAIGQQLFRTGDPYSLEIVGVVADWHQRSLKHSVHPIFFLPTGAVLQSARSPEATSERLRRELRTAGGISPDLLKQACG